MEGREEGDSGGRCGELGKRISEEEPFRWVWSWEGTSQPVGGASMNKLGGWKARNQHGGAGRVMGRILAFVLSESWRHCGGLSGAHITCDLKGWVWLLHCDLNEELWGQNREALPGNWAQNDGGLDQGGVRVWWETVNWGRYFQDRANRKCWWVGDGEYISLYCCHNEWPLL